MQHRQVLLVIVMTALLLALTAVDGAVNPNGDYTCTGQFRYVDRSLDYTGTHTGSRELVARNKFKGASQENVNYRTQWSMTFDKKVGGTLSSTRKVSGQFTRSIFGVQQTTYNITQGTIVFKINNRGAVTYNASILGVGVSGSAPGSYYVCTMKGKKPPAA